MSQTPNTPPTERKPAADVAAGTSMIKSAARRDQLIAWFAALVLLVATIISRPTLVKMRRDIVRLPGGAEVESSKKRLASEFPRLALGGFRGLLAMLLWREAEDSKNDRKWMRLESLYDYIAILQPYVVSVYVFHAWNQAYNLSAQWHEQENKYKWVLDGLHYLYNGEEFNPSSPDLQLELGQMYFLKLGASFERIFYRKQWRTDLARLHELQDLTGDAPKTAALRHVYDSAVKSRFNIRLLADENTGKVGYGIEISGFPGPDDKMKRPYGVSPFYFAYCEYKRTVANRERPSTTGIGVLDAWPAMSLRMWCRDDLYYTADEIQNRFYASDQQVTDEIQNRFQGSTQSIVIDSVQGALYLLNKDDRDNNRPKDREGLNLQKALDKFGSSPKFKSFKAEMRNVFEDLPIVGPKAVEEFESHLKRFPGNIYVHSKHIAETQYYMELAKAESQLFEALVALVEDHGSLTGNERAGEKFAKTQSLYAGAYTALEKWIDVLDPDPKKNPMDSQDRAEYSKYGNNIKARMAGIANLVTALEKKETMSDASFSFLAPDLVEK